MAFPAFQVVSAQRRDGAVCAYRLRGRISKQGARILDRRRLDNGHGAPNLADAEQVRMGDDLGLRSFGDRLCIVGRSRNPPRVGSGVPKVSARGRSPTTVVLP